MRYGGFWQVRLVWFRLDSSGYVSAGLVRVRQVRWVGLILVSVRFDRVRQVRSGEVRSVELCIALVGSVLLSHG